MSRRDAQCRGATLHVAARRWPARLPASQSASQSASQQASQPNQPASRQETRPAQTYRPKYLGGEGRPQSHSGKRKSKAEIEEQFEKELKAKKVFVCETKSCEHGLTNQRKRSPNCRCRSASRSNRCSQRIVGNSCCWISTNIKALFFKRQSMLSEEMGCLC